MSTEFRTVGRTSSLRSNILWVESIGVSAVYLYALKQTASTNNALQAHVLGAFGIIYMTRLNVMATWILQRELAMEEITFVPLVWLPSIMASYAYFPNPNISSTSLLLSTLLYAIGSYINTYSELERKWWKANPKHKGKCYMEGLFSWSRNINYFGDTLLFLGWALATGKAWTLWAPITMGLMFWFHHIPDKEEYLAKRYSDDWPTYLRQTPYAFIPFLC